MGGAISGVARLGIASIFDLVDPVPVPDFWNVSNMAAIAGRIKADESDVDNQVWRQVLVLTESRRVPGQWRVTYQVRRQSESSDWGSFSAEAAKILSVAFRSYAANGFGKADESGTRLDLDTPTLQRLLLYLKWAPGAYESLNHHGYHIKPEDKIFVKKAAPIEAALFYHYAKTIRE